MGVWGSGEAGGEGAEGCEVEDSSGLDCGFVGGGDFERGWGGRVGEYGLRSRLEDAHGGDEGEKREDDG